MLLRAYQDSTKEHQDVSQDFNKMFPGTYQNCSKQLLRFDKKVTMNLLGCLLGLDQDVIPMLARMSLGLDQDLTRILFDFTTVVLGLY